MSVSFIGQGAAAWAAGIALQQLHRDLVVRTQRPAVPESAAPIPTAPVAPVIMAAARTVSTRNLPRLEQNAILLGDCGQSVEGLCVLDFALRLTHAYHYSVQATLISAIEPSAPPPPTYVIPYSFPPSPVVCRHDEDNFN